MQRVLCCCCCCCYLRAVKSGCCVVARQLPVILAQPGATIGSPRRAREQKCRSVYCATLHQLRRRLDCWPTLGWFIIYICCCCLLVKFGSTMEFRPRSYRTKHFQRLRSNILPRASDKIRRPPDEAGASFVRPSIRLVAAVFGYHQVHLNLSFDSSKLDPERCQTTARAL